MVQALPLRLRDGTGAILTALMQHVLFPSADGGEGIIVVELGGLASGLLACPGLGFRVQRYVHLSCDACERLAVAQLVPVWGMYFDGQLAGGAWDEQLVSQFGTRRRCCIGQRQQQGLSSWVWGMLRCAW